MLWSFVCGVSYYFFLKIVMPSIKNSTTNIAKTKNRILAIDAAPAAIPVKPNNAAIMAMMKKIAAHLSIVINF